MNLELTNEQAAALEKELRRIIDDDRYPLSPRNAQYTTGPPEKPLLLKPSM
jgi:hypothetical protein